MLDAEMKDYLVNRRKYLESCDVTLDNATEIQFINRRLAEGVTIKADEKTKVDPLPETPIQTETYTLKTVTIHNKGEFNIRINSNGIASVKLPASYLFNLTVHELETIRSLFDSAIKEMQEPE